MLHDRCPPFVESGLAKHGFPPCGCGSSHTPHYAARREVHHLLFKKPPLVSGPPCGRQDTLSPLRPSCAPCVPSRLRHGRTTRYGWGAPPDPTRTFTLPETPRFAWRDTARPELQPEVGARHARTLLAVSFRVEPVVTHPAPPQTRTCAMNAYGSSVTRVSAPLWRITLLPCTASQMRWTILGMGRV